VLVSGDVCLLLEGKGVVQAGQLSAVVDLSKAYICGMGCDAVPDLLGEGLIGVCGGC
jgi:hypothetical protein